MNMHVRVVKPDNTVLTITPCVNVAGNRTVVSVSRDMVREAKYVDFLYDFMTANVGDSGYFVLPFECVRGVSVTRFIPRSDTEYVSSFSQIYCYGMKKETGGIFGIITGCKYDYALVAGVKNNLYYTYPRFLTDGSAPEEDIVVEYYKLSNGDYSEMARVYREHQLKNGGCVPLAERVKKDKRLARSAECIAVRVRQGWKPAPSKVENQSLTNEPEMIVACTFDRVGELIDEMVEQNVRNVEFCLVGWNRMGHDGRYPQIFPAEPALGGEKKLKKLINKAKNLKFNIVGHTNGSDAYTVSELWDENYLLRNSDGSFYTMDIWSSGRAHKICPKRMYELFSYEHNEKMADLGFVGIHYADVITILPLPKCYHPEHPLTRKQSAYWYKKLMERGRRVFGGFSSESGYDYAASSLDYALYTSFSLSGNDLPEICDEPIPFWQLVYHGIILYNPGTYTLNYAVKKNENRLKYFEYGGRPLACVYANFAEGRHWMGQEDMRCGNDEELKDSVSKIKCMVDDYEWMSEVRYAFMQSHNRVSEGVYRIVYSNGINITVDYNCQTVTMVGDGVNKVLKL